MAYGVQTPRSRGTLCGLALIVLGGWGGVAPFVGPSIGYGFTPDTAWTLNHGRLYLSAIPGGVVLIAGLIIAMTRSRGFGGLWAFVAALGGAWFIAGAELVKLLPASVAGSITTGSPIETGAHRVILTGLAFYAGTGALIVFFAALALGRFSLAAYRDYADVAGDGAVAPGSGGGPLDFSAYQAGQNAAAAQPAPTAPQYPPHDPFGLTQTNPQYPAEQYPTSQYPGSQYPGEQSPFGPAQPPFPPAQYPTSPDPFGATHTGYTPAGYSQPLAPDPGGEQAFGQPDPDSPGH